MTIAILYMWQGINNITGFKGNKPATMNIAASLLDELNHFYACFEAHNNVHTESAPAAAAEEVSPLSISVTDVTPFFKRVNIRKAVGPDGIPGRVLRACAFQLAGVSNTVIQWFQRTRDTQNLYCRDGHHSNLKCKYSNILRYRFLIFMSRKL